MLFQSNLEQHLKKPDISAKLGVNPSHARGCKHPLEVLGLKSVSVRCLQTCNSMRLKSSQLDVVLQYYTLAPFFVIKDPASTRHRRETSSDRV